MAINKHISAKEILIRLYEDLDETDLFAPAINRWVKQADFKIGNFRSWKRDNIIGTVSNLTFTLPDNAVHLNGLILGEYNVDYQAIFSNCYQQYYDIIEAESDVIFDWNQGNVGIVSTPYRIVNNQVVFDANIMENRKVTADLISYEVDSDGFIMIPEINLDACQAYVEWKLIKKLRWNKFKKGKLTHMDNNMVIDIRSEYHRYVQQARVADEDHGRDQTIRQISKMINHPLKGFGNAITTDIWR